MSSDAWPHPDQPRSPLPRIEDLPIAEQGYEQEAVRAAFDSFYRHAAQLDASLRALEAVDVFRRDADALRNDLRALRELGGLGAGEPAWATQTYERPAPEVPAVAFRLLFEAALIIAVAVIAGVAHLRPVVIVALMAGAFVVVAVSEWLAARARFVSPASGFGFVSHELLEPAPYVEAPAPAWGSTVDEQEADVVDDAEPEPADPEAPDEPDEPDEDTEPEALTVVGTDPWEHAGDEPEDEPEPAGHGFLRRLRR
jgi:hypothetical protein